MFSWHCACNKKKKRERRIESKKEGKVNGVWGERGGPKKREQEKIKRERKKRKKKKKKKKQKQKEKKRKRKRKI